MSGVRGELTSGVKAVLPILLGVIPCGMIYGVVAMATGLPARAAQAMSAIVFAGSAQFVAVQLLGAGTPAAIVLLTTFVINLRHVLYSASLAPYLFPLRRPWKWLLAFLLTDEAYALSIAHYRHRDPAAPPQSAVSPPRAAPLSSNAHWHVLGVSLTLWIAWQVSTAAGIYLSAQIPPGWSLDFTLALTLIALVVPGLRDASGIAAAVTAGGIAVVAAGLPFRLGLMIAAVTGIAAGLIVERRA